MAGNGTWLSKKGPTSTAKSHATSQAHTLLTDHSCTCEKHVEEADFSSTQTN